MPVTHFTAYSFADVTHHRFSIPSIIKGKRGNVRMSRYLLSFLKIIIIITMVQFCSFQWTVLLSVLCYYILSYVVELKLGSLFVSPFPPEFYVKSETKNRAWSQVRQGLDGRGLKLGQPFFFFKFYCQCLQNHEKNIVVIKCSVMKFVWRSTGAFCAWVKALT